MFILPEADALLILGPVQFMVLGDFLFRPGIVHSGDVACCRIPLQAEGVAVSVLAVKEFYRVKGRFTGNPGYGQVLERFLRQSQRIAGPLIPTVY